MIRPLKIAHTSDVHLSDDADGHRARHAFSRVVDLVRDTGADLFVVAGDLFDHNRVTPPVLEFACRELARVRCATVMIAGNHDCWTEDAALRRLDIRDAGPHVALLTDIEGTRLDFPALDATVWGRCLVDHHPGYRPLAGAPPRHADRWHIGVAHGLYMDDPNAGRSSPITPAEIAASGFDYLALGHVHVHRQYRHGRTVACYPGSPVPGEGAYADGSMALVELMPGNEPAAIVRPLRVMG
jgi:DNA repair exonuclease SbcCD nuclease subunit